MKLQILKESRISFEDLSENKFFMFNDCLFQKVHRFERPEQSKNSFNSIKIYPLQEDENYTIFHRFENETVVIEVEVVEIKIKKLS